MGIGAVISGQIVNK